MYPFHLITCFPTPFISISIISLTWTPLSFCLNHLSYQALKILKSLELDSSKEFSYSASFSPKANVLFCIVVWPLPPYRQARSQNITYYLCNRFKVDWIEEIKSKVWEKDQKQCNRRFKPLIEPTRPEKLEKTTLLPSKKLKLKTFLRLRFKGFELEAKKKGKNCSCQQN